jgi:hypothetical protein
MKEVPATGEALSPQKGTSSISNSDPGTPLNTVFERQSIRSYPCAENCFVKGIKNVAKKGNTNVVKISSRTK